MEPIQSPGRAASTPIEGVTRTALGATAVATAVIGLAGVTNPVIAAAAVALGTGILSGAGKVARDYLAGPAQPGAVGAAKSILANAFAWLG